MVVGLAMELPLEDGLRTKPEAVLHTLVMVAMKSVVPKECLLFRMYGIGSPTPH